MSDANRGPQDATLTPRPQDLPLFASRSMSAYYIDLFGPLHWLSKRQSVTAGSSTEAVIYAADECVKFAADECVKFLLELVQILEFLGVKIPSCLLPISYIMIIKHVLTGRNAGLRKVYATYR